MGQVLKSFQHGYPGAIARAADDVVVAFGNKLGAAIPFGTPVVLDAARAGVIPFKPASHTAEDFVGITVRNPAKTPTAYGSREAAYEADDLVDVLVRGHIVVRMDAENATLGDPVVIRKSDAAFSVGTGDGVVPLSNVRVSAAPGSSGLAEVLITERNKL